METPKLEDIIKGHMLEGFVDSSKIHDEGTMQTLNDQASRLRFTVYNTYPERTTFVNCARVHSRNHYATNGIVHMIDKVMMPASKTVGEIIGSDAKFTKLAAALEKSGILEKLREPDGQFTFFAPTNEAFDKLDDDIREKVESGNGCSSDVLSHHLLPNVICSSVITSKAKTVNSAKKYIGLERDADDILFVENREIVAKDVMATNGVIHVIEEVIVPESARSVDEALYDQGSETLAELFELADLDEELDDFSNVTVFAPSERALAEMPEDFMKELRADKAKLREFLLYHVTRPKSCKCDLDNNKLLQTSASSRAKLRINNYTPFSPLNILDLDGASSRSNMAATVQCAKVVRLDEETCGGMIHTVDKVLLPPGGKIVEIIKDHGDFGKFIEVVEFSELETELNTDGPFTLLAPTDSAMAHLKKETLDKIMADKDLAVKFVNKHVIRDMLCCAGIPHKMPFFDISGRRTASGEVISVQVRAQEFCLKFPPTS